MTEKTNHSTPTHSEHADAIRKIGREWDAAVAARDLDRLIALSAPDAYNLDSHTPPLHGSAAIREYWGQVLAMPGLRFTTVDQVVEVAQAADLAYVIGAYKFGFDSPAGRVEDEGKYTLIYRNTETGWKLAVATQNTNLPAPDMSN